MEPLGESSSLTSEHMSTASNSINDEFLVVHGASQLVYQHPWGTQTHALAKSLLPTSRRNLFDTNVVADTDDLMHEPSMQALAVCSKLAFLVGQSASRGAIPLTVLPDEPPLALFLDAPFFVIALPVIGTALPVQLAL